MAFPTRAFVALLSCALAGPGILRAQAPSSAPPASSAKASAEQPYPEQAYISTSRYLNQFFKFTFEFPSVADLRAEPEPDPRDGSIELLELQGSPPVDAEIAVAAIPVGTGRDQDAKAYLRDALDQELYRGVEELRGLSKTSLSGHQFFFFETRRGIDQHVLLATTLDGYIVRIVLASHDEKVLKQMEASLEHIVFFSEPELHQYLDANAHTYDGPCTSTHRLAALLADPPVQHLDAGKVRGDFYENDALGFSYRIPQGWTLEAEGAVVPAVERSRARENFGRPVLGPTERKLLQACSRTLFSAWESRPGPDGQLAYDNFGEVTVSAISTACFPEMKFPENVNDRRAFKDFLLQFGLTHPIVDDMRDGKAFVTGGNIFLFLHGTVGFQVPSDELSRRLSIALAVTERRGFLLTWFFAAPHDSELQGLTDERVIFDPEPGLAKSSLQPGGGTASSGNLPPAGASSAVSASGAPATPSSTNAGPASPAASSSAAAHSASASTAATPAASSSAAASAGNATSAPANANSSTSSAQAQPSSSSPAPTLLRPGETMESQRENGAPIKTH